VNETPEQFDPRRVNYEEVDATLNRLFEQHTFDFPISIEAQSQFIDVVSQEFRALSGARAKLMEKLKDEDHGWNEDQIRLLGTGFEMALIVIHGLITE